MHRTRTLHRSLTAALAVAAAFAPLASPAPVDGQQAPPQPTELREVSFPEFQERSLSNGARLLVVPQDEIPFVTLNLVIPGGSTADPSGREGTASFVAQLLQKGTETRTAEEIAAEVDYLGASLSAGASNEWTTVTLASLTSTLDEALALMADVVMNPSFPGDEVELLRTRTLSGLQVALSQAGTLATREFTRVLYGDHAYGRLETPATVEAVGRDDIATYHDTWFSPDGALFVVAGSVDADDIAARLEDAFSAWTPQSVPAVEFGEAPTRTRPEIVLVHKPGTVQAEVRVGHLLPGGDFEDYTALSVANQILGGGSSGRLFQVLREERGYTYGAYSSLSRSRRASRFQASMAVRNEVAGEAVQELLNQIEGIRSSALPADELSDTQSFLTGVFPLQIETPQQVASQVTTNRLLGLPEDAIETYRARVTALDTAAVRGAAQEHIRPEHLAIVVAGDAAQLQPQLAALGQVRIVDPDGSAITMADLAPRAASEGFDLSGLEPVELTYDVVIQGNAMGEMAQTLERVDGAWRLASTMALGPQTISQAVVVDDELVYRSSSMTMQAGPQTVRIEAAREGDRVVGSIEGGPQSQEIDFQAADDVVVSDALDLALRVVELAEGKEITLPVANMQSGSVENVTVTVVGREEITVPAGTFDAWKVEVGGAQPQTLWLRDAFPHIPLRLAPRAQPVELQLKAVGSGGAG